MQTIVLISGRGSAKPYQDFEEACRRLEETFRLLFQPIISLVDAVQELNAAFYISPITERQFKEPKIQNFKPAKKDICCKPCERYSYIPMPSKNLPYQYRNFKEG